MKTFAVMTLGCKVTDYESNYVKQELLKEYELVDFKSKADIYVIFSCCVTNTAESKTRKFIHQARRNNPEAYIAVVGCLAQIKPQLIEFKDVDLIIGSAQKDKIAEYIKNGVEENCVKDLKEAEFEFLPLNDYVGKDRAFLKIEDGCNQFCTYCVIPYARGRERSAKHEDVLNEAKELSKKFKEIVLTGIHTGRYNDNGYKLIDLLKDLVKIEGLETIRLSSIEMNEISDEMIELMASNSKLAHHLHIPVQATSNEVLKMMNRTYNIDEFIDRVRYIREKVPGVSISTDLIVGFPGESDEIFAEGMKMLEKIEFSFIHCFPYSKKTGTVAEKMKGHIDPKIKKERVKVVERLQKPLTLKYYTSFIDKDVKVLIEKNRDGKSYGYTKEYIYTELNGEYEVGSIIDATIKSVSLDKVLAEHVIK